MLSINTIVLFALAALALLLVPGPVVLYTVTRSIHQGRNSGIVSTVAVGLGDFCHVLMATLGLSALLLSSAIAFSVVKYAGAAYLIYLGIRVLRSPDTVATTPDDLANAKQVSLRNVFTQGFLVSLLNPKTALFFIAFLPQFVNPAQGAITTQILLLGSLFVLLGVCTNIVYVILASTLGGWIKGNRSFARGQRYFTGGVYIALGLTTALTGAEQ